MTWKSVQLSDVTDVITKGTTPTTLGYDFTDKGIPFLRVQNIEGGKVCYDRDTLFIDERTHKALSRSQIQPNDVLISIAGTIGRAGLVPPHAPSLNCNQAVAIVRPRKEIFRPFLRFWLASSDAQRQMRASIVTGTISNLSLSQLGNLKIPLPPLKEQRRIANVLNLAEALRGKRRATISQLDSLTQSIFLDLFGDAAINAKGWPSTTLGDLVNEFRYGSSNKSSSRGKPALRIPNIADGKIDLAALKLIAVDAAEFERLRLRNGDLLFVRTNGNPDFVGRCAIFDSQAAATSGFDGTEFIFASYLIRARFTDEVVTPLFVREYLSGAEGRRHLRARCKTSAGQFNINTEGLAAIPVPVPTVELQREFAGHVAAVEKLKAAQRASLAEMDALFASLQHRAFTGQL